jgi:hypothetical protein
MEALGLIESLRGLFQDFNGGLFVGLTSVLFILINILRGKSGFKIPWLTKAFEKIKSKAAKTWIILGLFSLTGGLMTIGEGFAIWIFLDGLLAGLCVGFTTLGVRHGIKTTNESDGVTKLKEKMKNALKRKPK